jgi:hypothetical protein
MESPTTIGNKALIYNKTHKKSAFFIKLPIAQGADRPADATLLTEHKGG